MSRFYWVWAQHLLHKRPAIAKPMICPKPKSELGLTLVELLVAAVITSVVVLLMFSAFINLLGASKTAESKTNRRTDLSRAYDFMSDEVRTASRINRTSTMAVGGGNTLNDVLTSAGLNNTKLGNPGTVVLYLEIPITMPVPDICPSDGPNAGAPPPAPATYDQVVYDIRPSSQDWLPPRSIRRYGRIPQIDGNLNPCSDPVASDTLVDAIANTNATPPTCTTGQLFGTEGFHACVDGTQVQLSLDSHIAGVRAHSLYSRTSSRVTQAAPPPVLQLNRTPGSDTVTLNWQWSGDAAATFKVYRTQDGGGTIEIYAGSGFTTTDTLTGTAGLKSCFTVVATPPASGIASPSNSLCEAKVDAVTPPPPPPTPPPGLN